jgi:xanthine/uracil permease
MVSVGAEPLVVPCSAAVTTVLVGFQHYLVMLGTTVLIATIIVPLMGGGHVRLTFLLLSFPFISSFAWTWTDGH